MQHSQNSWTLLCLDPHHSPQMIRTISQSGLFSFWTQFVFFANTIDSLFAKYVKKVVKPLLFSLFADSHLFDWQPGSIPQLGKRPRFIGWSRLPGLEGEEHRFAYWSWGWTSWWGSVGVILKYCRKNYCRTKYCSKNYCRKKYCSKKYCSKKYSHIAHKVLQD